MAFPNSVGKEKEDEEEEPACVFDSEAQRQKVRLIIKHQKYLYYSSTSSSSFSSSEGGSSCSSRKSVSLLDLMKRGSTSLGRLFDMEHTSLKTYLRDYSHSPLIKPIFLWGSDTDDGKLYDPWISIKQARDREEVAEYCSSDGLSVIASDGSLTKCKSIIRNSHHFLTTSKWSRRLTRKKSFRRLPEFRFWIFAGFKLRLRVRRLRVMICGRKF